MKIVSLNVGRPQLKTWNGKGLVTSIFKQPVKGRRNVSFTNIEGDEQSDLSVHGGVNKAVYSYDVSYYQQWKNILQREDWSYGLFGENLTTAGLPDEAVRIGNIYQIGSVKLQAVQPRFPCIKINLRFDRPDMIALFTKEKKAGIYFRVIEEGSLQIDDEIQLVEQSPYGVTITDYVNAYFSKGADKAIVKTLLAIPFLPERHRAVFESFLHNE